MISAVITVVAAIAVVTLGLLEIAASMQKRFDLSARLLTAQLVASVFLLAVTAADNNWWLAALWALCIALTVWNLRRTNRKREAHTA